MFLSDFSIKRPMVTIVIIIMLMCMGLLALKNLRVNANPDVQEPVIVVTVAYPGASPETVEREIVNRLEKPLQSIPGIDQMRSTANESNAQIVMIFKFGTNMIEASDQIRNAIASVRYKMPVEMREPQLERENPDNWPIMELGLSSDTLTHSEISRLAEDQLADKLRGVDGVATVAVDGALRRELTVLLQAEKLRAFNVSVTDVVNALRDQNTNAPVGKVRDELSEQSIRLVGRIETPAEFEQIIVKHNGDQLVRLSQVATIADSYAEVSSISVRNGHPNITLEVSKAHNASTVSIAKKIREFVAETNKTLPPGTKMEVNYDGGKDAQNNLDNVTDSLMVGAVLTIFVVFIFLNSWRSTLITALSLPTSAIAAFIAVWACGFTLNFMTLLGLSLAIGVLIDDAIVVRENIVRHMEMGKDRRTAALEGTSEIGMAVASTTMSIIAVFIPVAFMQGEAGEWFRPFALTVATSVFVSLFISFTLDPMLSAYWGDPIGQHLKAKHGISLLLARFNHWFDHQADRYGRVIAWALHHRKSMAVIAAMSLVGAIGLQMTLGGSEFLPAMDFGQININVRTPSSSSLEYNRLKVEKAAELVRTMPEVVATNSTIDASGGRISVDIGKSTKRKRSAKQIAVDMRVLMTRLVGAEYVIQDDVNNGGQKPVQLKFYGTDSAKLTKITNDFMAQMRNIPGAVDVGLSEQQPKDELQIELNRGLANSLGISVADAAQDLRVAFAGVEVGDWIDPTGLARDVAVRLQPSDRLNAENIEHLPISVPGTNTMVPLDQIASINMSKGPAKIEHNDGKRMVNVSCNVQGRSAGEVTSDAIKLAKAIDFPDGFGIELGGAAREQQELFTEMVIALVMGIGLMYLILVMQFGSFTAPIAVMMSLPLSLIGVVLALLLTGGTINLMSLIGIIMLMGLVAKNAILLLDCARKHEAEGNEREESLMYAGRKRLRPILMTTFALIAGMLPVAIGMGEGGEFYRPLAIAIIGGTITSTILTLLVVPTFYDSIEISRDRLFKKLSSRSTRMNTVFAFVMTMFEALMTLLLIRWLVRMVVKFARLIRGTKTATGAV